ncbi:MAG: beta-lactamase family protein [Candidatus Sumerlaeaceae bacterium]|nr:beta-lactamase family protein [Candidatus Sumerlaeaceae bacterium]
MSSIYRILLCCTAVALMATASKAAPKTAKYDLGARLDEILTSGVESKVYPGAVLIVGQPGKTLYAKAFGHFTYDTTAPAMQMDTMFDLASVSKVAGTATAAMLLIDDRKLSIDDLVTSRIPGFGANGKDKVTVKDLLTHVSGLKAYENKDKVEKSRQPNESHSDALIRDYSELKLSYEPRTSSTYSCLNLQTMARVNETILADRQDKLLKQRVYGPLGMKDTGYVLTPEQKKRCAPTVLKPDGTLLQGEIHDPLANYHGVEDHCPGNAGLFSTAPDLAKLCEMYINGGKFGKKQIIKAETVRMMTQNQMPAAIKDKRGLGWDIYTSKPYVTDLNKTPETTVVGHTGYTGTLLWLDKNSKTYVVLLTNRTYPDDASKKKGQLDISTVRKMVCDAVLRAQPMYKSYYAQTDKKK